MNAWLRGKKLRLDPARALGKGGEAEVFDIGGGRAAKVFKPPDHPDYAGQPDEQEAARRRIAEHQRKLRAFPAALPAQVVAPEELLFDAGGKDVLGYVMRLVPAAEPLARWGDPAFRRAGASQARAAAILRGLHATLRALHAAGVVVGDLNDLNLLVPAGDEAVLIDADSFQFGPWLSRVFTERFVDPLVCDPSAAAPVQVRPHSRESDWYAFAALVCQTLLCVGPHGGVHRPKDPARRCPQPQRALRRISVFHPEVQYPRPAMPPKVLPDELLHALVRIFERDVRGEPPAALLEGLEFRRCPRCAVEHAHASCPVCSPHAAAPAAMVGGEVRCSVIARTPGVFVAAAAEGGELRWLAHQDGRFLREDGGVAFEGQLDPLLRFGFAGRETLVGRLGELALLPGPATGASAAAVAPVRQPPRRFAVDVRGTEPAFAACGPTLVVCAGGLLQRLTGLGVETIGEALASRTRLWGAARLGLGLYDAGSLCRAFLFAPSRRGVNDSLPLPPIRGQLAGAAAVLSDSHAWLRLTVQERGRRAHHLLCYDAAGALRGEARAPEGDEPWLDALPGACAAGEQLFAPTDAGLVRIDSACGVSRRFPETAPFLDSACRLFVAKGGIAVVDRQEIRVLHMP